MDFFKNSVKQTPTSPNELQ